MKIPDIAVFAVVVILLAAIFVLHGTTKELKKTRKVMLVTKKKDAQMLKDQIAAAQVSAALTPVADTVGLGSIPPRTQDGIVPWSAAINSYDQYTGGYRNIGTATSQDPANDSTFILLAKPANSRYTKFWYRIKCAVTDRFCDVYLENSRDRMNSGETLTVSELPNDSPLTVSLTEAWYLYS